jgi:hypothetical protein
VSNQLGRVALSGKRSQYEMVLTNPPFGKKSSVTIVNEAGDEEKQSLVVHRDDFWASTSNKQLNFLQHIFTILKQHGRAAIVVPDNDSHLPSCSLFGLRVHVGRSRDLHCPFRKRTRPRRSNKCLPLTR